MHPHDILGPLGAGGDLVDVQVGRVRRQDRAGLAQCVELREDVLLHVHILIHRLDHQIAVGKCIEVERRGQRVHRGFDLIGFHPALGSGRLVILADDACASVQRFLLHLDDRDGDSRGQEVHRDAAAHRAGADHADLVDRAQLGVGGHVVDLRRLTFGEEQMPLRGGLDAAHQLHEFLALERDPVGEARPVGCLFDAGDVCGRGLEATEAAGVLLLERRNRVGIGGRGLLGRAGQGAVRRHLAGVSDRILGQRILADDLVDQPGVECLLRGDRIALRGHLQRQRDTGDARDTLRATGTRQQAELHLGRADLRAGGGNTVVAAQRHLAPAAERGPMDRGDDRLGRCFDHIDDGRQARLLHRFSKFGNVRARKEGAAVAANDHRGDRRIRDALLDRRLQPLPDRRAERVDRGVVGDDDEDVVMAFGADGIGHGVLLTDFRHAGPVPASSATQRVARDAGSRDEPGMTMQDQFSAA